MQCLCATDWQRVQVNACVRLTHHLQADHALIAQLRRERRDIGDVLVLEARAPVPRRGAARVALVQRREQVGHLSDCAVVRPQSLPDLGTAADECDHGFSNKLHLSSRLEKKHHSYQHHDDC